MTMLYCLFVIVKVTRSVSLPHFFLLYPHLISLSLFLFLVAYTQLPFSFFFFLFTSLLLPFSLLSSSFSSFCFKLLCLATSCTVNIIQPYIIMIILCTTQCILTRFDSIAVVFFSTSLNSYSSPQPWSQA